MSKYKIRVDDFDFEFEEAALDVVEISDGTFHILKGGKSYQAKILSADPASKTFSIEINNTPYQVNISDQYDQLVKKLGLGAASHQIANDVKAPMPGLVLDVSVKEGQEVKKGDGLLILEAMKMENVIKSMGDGKIKTIRVQKGAAVDKGQLLIEMEQA